ncbi:MAG: DUF1902 domain-containing protein [Methylococcales bacterium]|nr:DUF1902 domain-containing protein [Methylococcales bacterium]
MPSPTSASSQESPFSTVARTTKPQIIFLLQFKLRNFQIQRVIIMYRLGWFFSEFFASMGIPLLIKVDVLFDDEANVYVATSHDLKGLIVEAETLDELEKEVKILLPEILALNAPNLVKSKSTYCAFNQAPFAV